MSSIIAPQRENATRIDRSRSPLSFSADGGEFDLIGMLLEEQQSLTAVEQFSRVHDSGMLRPAQAVYYERLMPASPPGPGQQFAFEVNLDTCSGCKACVVACHTMNGLEETESWRRVGSLTIGEPSSEQNRDPEATHASSETVSLSAIGVQHVTTACHHCEDPGCLNGCPVKAYVKDPATGIVRHLDDQCIGCKYCTMMCPYEVPKYSKRLGIVRKCDMCHQRLKTGEAPACVQACPNEAIAIRLTSIPAETDPADTRLVAGAPLSGITRPTTRYVTERSDVLRNSTPQDALIDEVAESHWPLVVMLVATQTAVGMIVLERIAWIITGVAGIEFSAEATRWTLSVSFLIAMIGLNIAALHLGRPLRAWRVFLGLRTSWLSREAVLLGKFAGALGIATLLAWFPIALPVVLPVLPTSIADAVPGWLANPTRAIEVLTGLACVLGVAGLYSSAMIYVATRRTLWSAERTLPRFLSTAFIPGASLAALTIGSSSTSSGIAIGLLALAAFSGATKLLLENNALGSQMIFAMRNESLERRRRRLITTGLSSWKTTRWVVGSASVFVSLLAAVAIGSDSLAIGLLLAMLASIGFLVSETAERLLYFMSVVFERMPGTLK